jgi:hypothetical protein
VRRVPLTIAWIVLTALLTDSVMHDPDVHPAASSSYLRVRSAVGATVDRVVARVSASPNHSGNEPIGSSETEAERTHSPDSHWYWSTIAVMAVAGIWLLRLAVTVTFRNRSRPADHDASLHREPQP